MYDGQYKIYNKKRDDVNKSRMTDAVSRSARLVRDVCATKANPRGVRQLLAENKPRFFSIAATFSCWGVSDPVSITTVGGSGWLRW